MAEEQDLWQKERALLLKTRHVAEIKSLIRSLWQKKGPCVAERNIPVPEELDLWQKETDLVAEEEDLWQKEESLWQK